MAENVPDDRSTHDPRMYLYLGKEYLRAGWQEYVYLGKEYSKDGHRDDALAAFSDAIALSESASGTAGSRALSENLTYIEALEHRAKLYLIRRDIDAALADADRLVELQPTLRSYFRRACIVWHKGDETAALAAWDRVFHLRPDNPFLYYYRAVMAADWDYYGTAQTDFDEVIRRAPVLIEAYVGRAGYFMRHQDYARATAYYSQALALVRSPDHFVAACALYGTPEHYQTWLARIFPPYHDDPIKAVEIVILSRRARAYEALQAYEQALADYDAISAIHPEPRVMGFSYRRDQVLRKLAQPTPAPQTPMARIAASAVRMLEGDPKYDREFSRNEWDYISTQLHDLDKTGGSVSLADGLDQIYQGFENRAAHREQGGDRYGAWLDIHYALIMVRKLLDMVSIHGADRQMLNAKTVDLADKAAVLRAFWMKP